MAFLCWHWEMWDKFCGCVDDEEKAEWGFCVDFNEMRKTPRIRRLSGFEGCIGNVGEGWV